VRREKRKSLWQRKTSFSLSSAVFFIVDVAPHQLDVACCYEEATSYRGGEEKKERRKETLKANFSPLSPCALDNEK
jgi:hypothetical protein